jgi:hypothetical protein
MRHAAELIPHLCMAPSTTRRKWPASQGSRSTPGWRYPYCCAAMSNSSAMLGSLSSLTGISTRSPSPFPATIGTWPFGIFSSSSAPPLLFFLLHTMTGETELAAWTRRGENVIQWLLALSGSIVRLVVLTRENEREVVRDL